MENMYEAHLPIVYLDIKFGDRLACANPLSLLDKSIDNLYVEVKYR